MMVTKLPTRWRLAQGQRTDFLFWKRISNERIYTRSVKTHIYASPSLQEYGKYPQSPVYFSFKAYRIAHVSLSSCPL